MDSETRRSYEELVGATRNAFEALMPTPKKRTRKRQDVAQKLRAQMAAGGSEAESAVARYMSGMARDLRGATPEEESRVPGELI